MKLKLLWKNICYLMQNDVEEELNKIYKMAALMNLDNQIQFSQIIQKKIRNVYSNLADHLLFNA